MKQPLSQEDTQALRTIRHQMLTHLTDKKRSATRAVKARTMATGSTLKPGGSVAKRAPRNVITKGAAFGRIIGRGGGPFHTTRGRTWESKA